jgi:hypothetical protein
MYILIFYIWMTVPDYNTNPTVIILVGIGNFPETLILFIGICMTVSDYNTNPTVNILVGIGILQKCMF